MFSTRITAAVTTAIGAAAVGLAIATAGSAAASTDDAAFISQMESVGVTFSSPQAADREGHQVCQELASGKTGTDIAEEILSQTDLTSKQAAYFVVYAIKDYCPQYASQLA
ncbi:MULTISPECIES: DUF732 domain-containing protein [Mycobacterium]|uniref:DUF732 domain-containing protein n=1 Tax=Mycobacterium pseudoshottsii TaxID=265949 RepID=A0A9N7QM36_9MYCO|nr:MULTISPECIES: DUF732 domain-containing protein [Mycobacterium]EPQ48716.1 hypothetical protein MMSP_4477 [Mycobacterium sp. 012931]MBC9864508.1 hypothetical protein [Mycobacterium pseudoshottsii]RFZ67357.1 hypothetical protein DL240490_01835 [Mycobacterium marinum]BBA87323.1 hypothetical protein MPSD_17220 [Mycobacterium pseudoshottsii JCM 15466]BDN81485.1 hypothetical protein NJB1907Z4_C17000 [Mycobacterium pseudoshottsii]